jgi:hypothetical protein
VTPPAVRAVCWPPNATATFGFDLQPLANQGRFGEQRVGAARRCVRSARRWARRASRLRRDIGRFRRVAMVRCAMILPPVDSDDRSPMSAALHEDLHLARPADSLRARIRARVLAEPTSTLGYDWRLASISAKRGAASATAVSRLAGACGGGVGAAGGARERQHRAAHAARLAPQNSRRSNRFSPVAASSRRTSIR